MILERPNFQELSAEELITRLSGDSDEQLIRFVEEIETSTDLVIAAEKLMHAHSIIGVRLLAHASLRQRKYQFACDVFSYMNGANTNPRLPDYDLFRWATGLRALERYDEAISTLDRIPVQKRTELHLLERAINEVLLTQYSEAIVTLHKIDAANRNEKNKLKHYRSIDWLTTYLENIVGIEPTGDRFSRRILTGRYSGRNQASTADIIIGVLDFKSPEFRKSSMDIGDYIQTSALMRHCARHHFRDLTFDDDRLVSSWNELASTWSNEKQQKHNRSAHIAIIDQSALALNAVQHNNRTVWTFIYGGHLHNPYNKNLSLPLPDHIFPLFISFCLQRVEDLTPEVISYLKKHGPVGCRDWSTCYLLLNQGVDAFFTGCLSATVDFGDTELTEDIEPATTNCVGATQNRSDPDATCIKQNASIYRRMEFYEVIRESIDHLHQYRSAKSITTDSLHCYLPSVAMGSLVNFIQDTPCNRQLDGLDNLDEHQINLVKSRTGDLINDFLCQIADGASENQTRNRWIESTKEYVEEAKFKLGELPRLFPHENSAPTLSCDTCPTDAGNNRAGSIRPGSIQARSSRVTVALAFDQVLLEKASVTVASILANTQGEVEFYCLTRGISKVMFEGLKSKHKQATFKQFSMDGTLNQTHIHLVSNTTISTMDRLFLCELLPDHDRVIYLDVDLVVLGDIAELAGFNPSARGIAACPTPNPSHKTQLHWIEKAIKQRAYGADKAREYRRQTAATVDLLAPYFNAGVLVLSLDTLRQLNFTENIAALLESYGVEDQEALNLFSKGDYTHLPNEWNVLPYNYWCSEPKLIHWAGAMKPWREDRHILQAHLWKQYQTESSTEPSRELTANLL